MESIIASLIKRNIKIYGKHFLENFIKNTDNRKTPVQVSKKGFSVMNSISIEKRLKNRKFTDKTRIKTIPEEQIKIVFILQ